MQWYLEHSGKDYEFKLHAQSQGFDVKLTPRPDTDPYVDFFVDSFFDLCNFRIELQPISLVNICEYCTLYQVTDVEDFIKFITALDNKYREIMFERQQREMKKQAAKAKGKR